MPSPTSTPENYFQFEKLLANLARGAVDFAVVGGVAVSLNGFVRATEDVDILVHPNAHSQSHSLNSSVALTLAPGFFWPTLRP
jgi:hypothetical protein